MKADDFKVKWDQFRDQGDLVQRLDPNHPMDFFIGVSEKGYDELVLFTKAEPAQIKSSKALEITKKQRPTDQKWATRICSVERKNQDIFARLCLDLVETSSGVSSEHEGLERVTRRFLAWQRLFANLNTGLAKHVLKGLFGELVFAMETLSKRYSWDEILSAWQGPDGADRDYIFLDKWFEVKSISSGKETITISSLNQLDVIRPGYLVRINVDDSSSTDPEAVSVSEEIRRMRDTLGQYPNAAQLFEQKLVSLGFIDRPEYENIYFNHKAPVYYYVDHSFPKLTSANVDKAIVAAQYDISLSGIDTQRKEDSSIWI